MSAPVIHSWSIAPSVANPGDALTLTVNYTPGSSPHTFAAQGEATDTIDNSVSSPFSITYVVTQPDPTVFTISDPSGRGWVKVSDNGSQAVYGSTA